MSLRCCINGPCSLERLFSHLGQAEQAQYLNDYKYNVEVDSIFLCNYSWIKQSQYLLRVLSHLEAADNYWDDAKSAVKHESKYQYEAVNNNVPLHPMYIRAVPLIQPVQLTKYSLSEALTHIIREHVCGVLFHWTIHLVLSCLVLRQCLMVKVMSRGVGVVIEQWLFDEALPLFVLVVVDTRAVRLLHQYY